MSKTKEEYMRLEELTDELVPEGLQELDNINDLIGRDKETIIDKLINKVDDIKNDLYWTKEKKRIIKGLNELYDKLKFLNGVEKDTYLIKKTITLIEERM